MAKYVQTDFSKSQLGPHCLQMLNGLLGAAQSPELGINIDRVNECRFFWKIYSKPKFAYIPFKIGLKKNMKMMSFRIPSTRQNL